MAKPIDDVIAAVTAEDTIIDSAVAFINSVPGLITDAVNKALQNGATAAELAPLTALAADVLAKKDALAAALTANTPPAPTP